MKPTDPMTDPIPVNTPLLDGREREYLLECIDSGWISSEGPFVARFEESFARRVGRKYGVAVANGSMALDAAVVALGIGPGDEVILPTFTIISCAAAIVRAGAHPVYVDSDPETWNVDVSQLEARITPRTRAIMVVHIYGLPADMDPILRVAQRHRLAVIEDAAEMHGQTYRGRLCGSFGELSIFSFYPNKRVTTRRRRNDRHRRRTTRRTMPVPAESLLQAGTALRPRRTGLEHADDQPAGRSRAGTARATGSIRRAQAGNGQVCTRACCRASRACNCPCRAPSTPTTSTGYTASSSTSRWGSMQRKRCRGSARAVIGTRPFFWPMHEQPVLRRLGCGGDDRHPVAERLARRGFYVPSGLALTEAQIRRSAHCVREILA